MTFKFPSAGDLSVGAIGDIIQGGSWDVAASNALNKGTDQILSSTISYGQRGVDKLIGKVSSGLGINLGSANLLDLINDPLTGFKQLFPPNVGASTQAGGWLPLLQNRDDPLMEFDWIPTMPMGLPSEFVEEIQWSHARFTASPGIFRNGAHIYMIDAIEHAPINITFYEDRNLTVTSWLMAWREKIYNSTTGTFGYQKDYKQHIRAHVHDIKGNVVGQVMFAFCFPTSMPQVNFSSDGSTRVRLQVEFSVDRIVFQTNSPPSGAGLGKMPSLTDRARGGVTDAINDTLGSASSFLTPYINQVSSAAGDFVNSIKFW